MAFLSKGGSPNGELMDFEVAEMRIDPSAGFAYSPAT